MAFQMGIKVEGTTKNHIMYGLIDALVNYLTSINFPNTSDEQFLFWENCNHIIGKVYIKISCNLLASYVNGCKYSVTKKIFAHGWWTNEGKKISNQVGNVIDPNLMIEKYI